MHICKDKKRHKISQRKFSHELKYQLDQMTSYTVSPFINISGLSFIKFVRTHESKCFTVSCIKTNETTLNSVQSKREKTSNSSLNHIMEKDIYLLFFPLWLDIHIMDFDRFTQKFKSPTGIQSTSIRGFDRKITMNVKLQDFRIVEKPTRSHSKCLLYVSNYNSHCADCDKHARITMQDSGLDEQEQIKLTSPELSYVTSQSAFSCKLLTVFQEY